jgi:phage shock protein C
MNPDESNESKSEATSSALHTGDLYTERSSTGDVNSEKTKSENNPMNDNTQQEQTGWTNTGQTQSQAQSQGQTQIPSQTPFSNTMYRHPTDKMIGGVCGGLANYFKWDPALVRIVWLVATIVTGGGGLLAYIILWGLLPIGTVESGVQRPAAFAINERNIGRVAMVLIGLGGLWLLTNLGILPGLLHFFWWTLGIFFWPALLIGIGYLLLKGTGNGNVRIDLDNLKSRFQSSVNDAKMPSGDSLKSSFNQTRERFPLQRSTSDRLFLGVCGGIGKRLGIDANLVRLLWVAFSIGSIGMGALVYVALGLLLPEDKPASLTPYNSNSDVQNVEIVEGTTPRVM